MLTRKPVGIRIKFITSDSACLPPLFFFSPCVCPFKSLWFIFYILFFLPPPLPFFFSCFISLLGIKSTAHIEKYGTKYWSEKETGGFYWLCQTLAVHTQMLSYILERSSFYGHIQDYTKQHPWWEMTSFEFFFSQLFAISSSGKFWLLQWRISFSWVVYVQQFLRTIEADAHQKSGANGTRAGLTSCAGGVGWGNWIKYGTQTAGKLSQRPSGIHKRRAFFQLSPTQTTKVFNTIL